MERCPECAADVAAGVRWCGRCGALLGPHATGEKADELLDLEPSEEPGEDEHPEARSGWRRTLGVLLVVGAIGLAGWALAPDDDTGEEPVESAVAPVVTWEMTVRSDPVQGREVTVLPAGAGHVTVGRDVGDVLATRPGATRRPGLRRMPASLRAAVAADGTWAVVEGARIVRGDVASGTTRSTRLETEAWTPSGPAVAWRGDTAVFSGTGGQLGAVDDDGQVSWVSAAPVALDGAAGERWLVGSIPGGATAVVSLDDGTTTMLGDIGTPLAVVDDLVVVSEPGAVVGRSVPDGRRLWTRPVDRIRTSWTPTAEGLVEHVDRAAHLVDPRTGQRIASAGTADGLVAVAGGTVQLRGDVLVRAAWAGQEDVLAEVPGGAAARLVRIDDQRVAVVVDDGPADQVRVLDASDGTELAATRVQPSAPIGLVVADGRVGVTGEPRPPVRGPRWLDPATGAAVETPGAWSPGDEVVLGSITLAHAEPASGEDPFGRGPPQLVATASEDGTTRWTAPALAAAGPRGRPAAIVGRDASEFGPVVVEAGSAVLQGRFLDDGAVAWNVQLGGPLVAEPVLTGARVVVALGNGTVAGRDPARGLEVWATALDATPTAMAAVDGRVLLATADQRLVVLDSLGRPVSELDVGGEVHELVVAGGQVVAATRERVLGIRLAGPP